MQRFKKILFVESGGKGNKSAWNRAVHLAITNKAKLTIFDAIDVAEQGIFDEYIASKLNAIQKVRLKERRNELKALCDSAVAKNPGLKVTARIEHGDLAREAIRTVLAKNHDLLIKAPEGQGNTLFGSSDQKLIRKCPCPVWMLKQSRKKTFRKILAAVDTGRNEKEANDLAKQIMSLSTSLAKAEKSELHVLHAWQFKNEAKLRGRAIAGVVITSLERDLEAANQAQLDKLVQHFSYAKKVVQLSKGRPNEVIPHYAKENEIDLIVMGTAGRSGISGLIIGNTAESVLQSVDSSVLMLKPAGFKSPIKI
jgi:nucleotide-binding universal stress UspA family protein